MSAELTVRASRAAKAMVLAAALAVVATSCGGSSSAADAAAANYAAVDPVEEAEPFAAVGSAPGVELVSTAAEQTGVGVEPSDDYLMIETLLMDFLDMRADVITGYLDASELAPFAVGEAVEFVANERTMAQNLSDMDSPVALDQLHTWPNIVSIAVEGDELVVTDCTERQEVTTGGDHNISFVHHRYRLVPTDAAWEFNQSGFRVGSVETVHNGYLEEARFGCTPQSYAERAEASAATALNEMMTAARNPSTAAEISDIFTAEMRAQLLDIADAQIKDQLELRSSEASTLSTIGVDTHVDLLQFAGTGARGTTVVVEACRSFPDGLVFLDRSTGLETMQLDPGTEWVQWYYVRIPMPGVTDVRDQVLLVEDRPDLDCGDRP